MGNQNKVQNRIENSTAKNQAQINLDDIIEQWAWNMWNKTKTKSLSHYKFDDLLIKINWQRVSFIQYHVKYYNSSFSCFPRTIFRTNFDNQLANEQSHTVTTKKATNAIFKFIFSNSLYKPQGLTMVFRLPEEIIQVNDSIQHEQYIECGQDITKEYQQVWSVNNQISVPSQTRVRAELHIEEEEFQSHFLIPIQFSGHITVAIATHRSPNTYLKYIKGDIVQIIRQAMKNDPHLNVFKITRENSPSICFTVHGQCLFRYGIRERIVLNQEPLLSALMAYQNLQSVSSDFCHLISSKLASDD